MAKRKNELIEIFGEKPKIEAIEVEGVKRYVISGSFTQVDKPGQNGRIYPREVMQNAINKLREKVTKGQVFMRVDHPGILSDGGNLGKTGEIMTEISDVQQDGKAFYKAQICDTAVGKDLKAILDAGGMIGVSKRGYGTSKPDQEYPGCEGKHDVINPDYRLSTIDFVDDPSYEFTSDDMHLESKEKDCMKTREQLKAEFPEIFAEIDKEFAEVNSKLTAANTTVESLNKTISEKDTLIQTATESVTAKDAEIKSLNEKIVELNGKVENWEKTAKESEEKATKEAKENAIAQILQKDPEFAKVAVLVKKFEVCQNAEEVTKVYEANRELMNEMKKSLNIQPPVTKVEDKKDEKPTDKLTESQRKEFARQNSERLIASLLPYSEVEFLMSYPVK
jgi:hypothetical protein